MEKEQKIIAEAFGLAVKVERVRRRLSQEDLAHQAGLNVSYLSRTERGLSQPTLWTIAKLASAMDMPTSKLVALATDDLAPATASPMSFDPEVESPSKSGKKPPRRR